MFFVDVFLGFSTHTTCKQKIVYFISIYIHIEFKAFYRNFNSNDEKTSPFAYFFSILRAKIAQLIFVVKQER